ncbi:dockerin type I repeat-containing protein [Ruminococcus flavefaciens]|uniref:Dockerin domain-containing protein n=1 Tax=Ruminococcus flavefaciens TaxID=1265 RepID=A0A1M7JM71_RUMFL|nr:dockerin type I repeat-containing protein [Ruminococcus flavefaciens]SHM53853.1 hypothetical protein SAMN04487860_10683 [Ruminococcus flavefaciens]
MNIKKTLAVLSASLMTFSYVSSTAVCSSASLISDLVDKLNNDVFEYGNTLEAADGFTYAKISFSSPDSTLEFKNVAESDITKDILRNYAGTIEISGEKYHFVRQKALQNYSNQLSELDNNYTVYRVCPEGTDTDENSIFPLYELIEGAQHFGFVSGKMTNVKFDENEYKCSCDVSALKLSDKTAEYDVYSDISKRLTGYILMDGYDFYTPEYNAAYGNEMIARPNGGFSITSKDNRILNIQNYVDSYAELNLTRSAIYDLNAKNDISIDYKINDSLEGKYGMVYTITTESSSDKRINYRIAEKISGMDIEEFFKSYEQSLGIGNHYEFKSYDLVNSYTANGHKYDLYKGNYHFYGEFQSYDETCYLAVRKDTADAKSYENSIDVYEHISRIADIPAENKVISVELSFHNCGALGKVDVTKNDIKLFENVIPEVIAGDFNNDRQVDSMDIVSARYAIISKLDNENAEATAQMDLNKNGNFDVADLVLLQSFVLGKIKTFPQA